LLTARVPRPAAERSLRLLAVACCRRVWSLLADERGRRAVETAEWFAYGLADRDRLAAAATAAKDAYRTARDSLYFSCNDGAVTSTFRLRALDAYLAAVHCAAETTNADRLAMDCSLSLHYAAAAASRGWGPEGRAVRAARDAEHAVQAALLRDVYGNPFRPPAVPDPAWLAWDGGAVPRLARAIYKDQRFGDLPILADTLEEAGCADADLLDHLRGPGPHVRGCWVLDLLLTKDRGAV
jgi:hypothetical protein